MAIRTAYYTHTCGCLSSSHFRYNDKNIQVSNIVTEYYKKLNEKNKKFFEKKEDYYPEEESKETKETNKCYLKKHDIINIGPYHEKIENGTQIISTCDCCDNEYGATILNSRIINNNGESEWEHNIIIN